MLENYPINVKKIIKLNKGSANLYKVYSDKDIYLLKEYPNDLKDVQKEIKVINYLKDKLPVETYIKTNNNKYYDIYKGKPITLRKYVNGYTYGNYSGDLKQILESSKYLGLIVKSLEEYPYNDMYECHLENYYTDDLIDKAILKHQKLLNKGIDKDIISKIDMLKQIKKEGTFKKINNLTLKRSHGDYNVLQFVYNDQKKIKSIIDFVNAGKIPIIWEIIRSYNYIDKMCQNNKFNIDNLILYIKEYLKYETLNKEDLIYGPYVYLISLLTSTYGYKEYLNNNDQKLLKFAKERTNICKYLIKNKEEISHRLLEI